MSVNTAARVSLGPAASRSTSTATQANVRLNAPLTDATARSACRATCVATRALICSRETRLARAKATKRARRALPSRRRSQCRSKLDLLDDDDDDDDEPWDVAGRPRGGLSWCQPTLFRTFLSGLDRTRLEVLLTTAYGSRLPFSSPRNDAQHGKLIYWHLFIGIPLVTFCIDIYSANLFDCHYVRRGASFTRSL